MGIRAWLTNLAEPGQIRLLNVQLDKLFRTLTSTPKNEKEEGEFVTFPLSIKNGGTGASNAEGAREALCVAAKDHEHSYKLPVVFSVGEEVLTGDTWIDENGNAKPIYRYIWKGKTSLSGAQNEICAIPSGEPETVISLRGLFKRSDGAWFPIANIYYGSIEWAVNMRTDASGNIIVGFGDKYTDKNRPLIIFVEYTKK